MIPAAPWRLTAVSVLPSWQLAVTFNDGTTGIVDVAELVQAPDAGVFASLRDADFFARVHLDCGALTWPNGADIAPDGIYRDIRENGVSRIVE